MDSTSWRIDGNPYNLWTFLTKSEAIFHISRGNGHEIPLELLKDHNGTDAHDRHSAFETLAWKSGNDQQYCWSHIICDAKELEDFYGDEGKRIKRSLQTVYDEAKAFNGHGTMEDVEKLRHKLVFLLDSDYDSRKCSKFVKNLLKRKKEWLFRFVMDPEVEPTNNRAERALRPSVIYRKVSGGSRSEKGAEMYTRIYSVYYTSRLRGKNWWCPTLDVLIYLLRIYSYGQAKGREYGYMPESQLQVFQQGKGQGNNKEGKEPCRTPTVQVPPLQPYIL